MVNDNDNEKNLTFYESLDVEQSRRSFQSCGTPTGYGPGLVMSFDEFNKCHRSRTSKLGDVLLTAGDSNVKAHVANSERLEKAEQNRMKKEQRAMKMAEIAEEKRA